MLTTLVDAETLATHLADSAFVIVDCRYNLDDEGWGEREYQASHIPGAVYVHLDRDLTGTKTGSNGRHPLPDPEALAHALGRLGIAIDMQVVAYDQDTGIWASRLWWLLRWLGHDRVAVLDGGLAKWLVEKRPTASGLKTHAPREFAGDPRPGMWVDADQVSKLMTERDWRIVDARAPERYRGDVEPIDRVGGHIPAAVNHFFRWNLDEDRTFRSPDAVRTILHDTVGDVRPEHVVCYCGSGVTACHNLLAFEHAGLHGAKLYPGSWSEWSSDPARPVERAAAVVT